jgi:putative membrane protein
MRLSPRMLVGAVLAVGLMAPAATAARSGGDHGSSWYGDPAPISAEAFLAQAAAANQFEIVTGQLAQERASSSEVKALGAEFVAHHTELLAKGRAVAAQLGITVPETLTPKQQRVVERLQQRTGKRFDRKWLKAQIAAHRAALALHVRGAVRGEVPEIRALAQGGLPVVADHYGQLLDLAGDSGWDHGHGHGGHDHGDDDHGHGGHHGDDDHDDDDHDHHRG